MFGGRVVRETKHTKITKQYPFDKKVVRENKDTEMTIKIVLFNIDIRGYAVALATTIQKGFCDLLPRFKPLEGFS
jgi:hypothetical protein